MLPKEAIEQFKKLYAKNYGIEISDEEAIRRANNLVAVYRAVYDSDSFGRIQINEDDNGNKTLP